MRRYIEYGFLSVFVLICSGWIGVAIIDQGCDQFNFPTYPFADLAGFILMLFGVLVLVVGVWSAFRLLQHIVLREKKDEANNDSGSRSAGAS